MQSSEPISISFGNRKVIENFSFSLGRLERLAIIGNNGAGKSSLALFLAGVIPDFIDAQVSGRASIPERVSLVMQNPSSQFLSMTVAEELGNTRTTGFALDGLLSKNVFELSEGEKQKVNLVSNLSANPEALLLDEPLELLDPREAKRFREAINKVKGIPIVWFDKSDEFPKNFGRKFLGEHKKTIFPKKRLTPKGKVVLKTSFSIENNGFSLPNVELELCEGEKIGLIGYNGSGKTTLLKAIAGIGKFDGEIRKEMPVSFAPQNPSHLFFRETVQEEIRCLDNLNRLCVNHLRFRNPATLSKGQQKLVSVATVLPKTVALLDEPTTWLDDENKATVYNFITNSNQPMLMATHDKKLLEYCDRVLLVEAGKGVCECSSTAANRFFLG